MSSNSAFEGHYVNYFKVGHNTDVFVIDYYQFFPGDNQAALPTDSSVSPRYRLIASPADAKLLLRRLESSIELYEDAHGKIITSTDT